MYIKWFKNISVKDVPLVGGKNASLGEMIKSLSSKGIQIPDGFAITSEAYFDFLKEGGIYNKIKEILYSVNLKKIKELQQAGKQIRTLILNTPLPKKLEKEIIKAYNQLSKEYGEENVDVAVRSSATAEDLPSASFAGQHETFLNVRGVENLLKSVKQSYASLFLDRAITYRIEKGFDHLKVAISTGVQKMVRSDLGASGVMFTLDTETGFKDVVVINSIYGLGELIVKGKIVPDEFLVFKPTLLKGYKAIIRKDLGDKKIKYVYNPKGGIKSVPVPEKLRLKFSLNDEEIITLAKWGILIEEHYSKINKRWMPQDIEWAKDGKSGQLFIVQARPETVHSIEDSNVYKEYQVKTKKEPLLSGIAIGNKVGQGKVRIIKSIKELPQLQKGEVLVTKMTDPDWTSAMPLASAIITDEGGKTCFGGDTLILTNKGFLPIKEVVQRISNEKLYTPSLNRDTLQIEWKPIINGFKREAKVLTINISQTGIMQNNILKTTPDHKFLTFHNRKLVSEQIEYLINQQKGILSTSYIPLFKEIPEENSLLIKEAYLLGAIFTDGNIYLDRRHGSLSFIQNPSPLKIKLIKQIKKYFKEVYGYNLRLVKKQASKGVIRGKAVKGKPAIVLRCYKKEIIQKILDRKKEMEKFITDVSPSFLYSFLAGVIDGDGSYHSKNNRINIYCSKEKIFRVIILALLRLGINYQVTVNRNIYNIQIIDQSEEIFKWTQRVKGTFQRKRNGVKLFFAKQLLEDIKHKVNYKGRIIAYIINNLLIDAEKIKNYCIPLIKGSFANHELTKIVNSNLKMYRVKMSSFSRKKQPVYNIEVKDNHNYLVFTNRLTPVIVENCHAAIISRELGIPCIVGTKKATKTLKTGQEVTVDCSSGAEGKVYAGKVPFKIKKYELKKIPDLKTKISINIGAPDIAFQTSFIPNDGVGLAREEFIIAEKIKIHPLALYHYEKLKNSKIKTPIQKSKLNKIIKQIEEITIEHKNKREYFIKELAEGVAQIAAAFYPKEVIVRFSDFKTNEYRQLIGGELFEPEEENPMLGWRGASRYYDPRYKPAFEMECLAMKRAIEVFGLDNISVMVPFCRTIEEGKKVKEIIRQYLPKTKIYVMAEIPSNALLINEFLDIFDGMSIGSNDLNQLVLGIDRDNADLTKIGNENNEAVKKMIKEIIKVCREKKKYVGICGQAPSDYPEFADFLVKEGITAISLNPDTVIKTILYLAKKK